MTTTEQFYKVENIEGFKFENDELKFLVKWEGYNEKQNTFESVHHVKYCQQFEQYIENLKAHLVHDIEINDARVARKLKDEILKTLNKPKAEILYMLVNFDDFTFEAYQVMFHLLSPNEIFYKQYDQLFLDHYILQLQKRQGESFQILQTDILKIEPFTLTFENNIDFSTIKSFNYISKNIFQLDLKHAAALNAMEETDPINYTKPPPVTVFKTKNRGWGVKSIGMIDRYTSIFECVGEVLTAKQAAEKADKSYCFSVKFKILGEVFTVDSSKHGNLSRFVNHSCSPNAHVISIYDSKVRQKKLFMLSRQDIAPGEEITIDYSFGAEGKHSGIECLCGSDKCCGSF